MNRWSLLLVAAVILATPSAWSEECAEPSLDDRGILTLPCVETSRGWVKMIMRKSNTTYSVLSATPTEGPDEVASGDATNGQTLFSQYCQACHGAAASGSHLSGADDASEIRSAIDRNTGSMGYLDNYLDDQDLLDIAAYVGSVRGTSSSSQSGDGNDDNDGNDDHDDDGNDDRDGRDD